MRPALLASLLLLLLAGCTVQYTDSNAAQNAAARPGPTSSGSGSSSGSSGSTSTSASTGTSTTTGLGSSSGTVGTSGPTSGTSGIGSSSGTVSTGGSGGSSGTTASGPSGTVTVVRSQSTPTLEDVEPEGNGVYVVVDGDGSGNLFRWQTSSGSYNALTTSTLTYPNKLARDASGNYWVAVGYDDYLVHINGSTGAVIETVGARSSPGSGDGDYGTARFKDPEGIAIDGSGNLVVADSGNNTIRYVDTSAHTVSTWAGSASSGSGYVDSATGTSAIFSMPWAVAVAPTGGLIYVVDRDNHRIRTIDPNGSHGVGTFAGSGATAPSDGTTSNAGFGIVWGIAIDTFGAVYVTDVNAGPNNAGGIRLISNGQVSTLQLGSEFAGRGLRVEATNTLITVDDVGELLRIAVN